MSKAADIARNFKGDPKGLPKNVQEAIADVEKISARIHKNVQSAEKLYQVSPDHSLALKPGAHGQTSWAQRFEVVDGEVLEITKESAGSKVRIKHRLDLFPAHEEDPVAALEASFRGEPDDGEE